jgi:hypothetical protein
MQLFATPKCSAKSSISLSLALPFSGGAATATSSIPFALTETPSFLADGLTFTVNLKANSLLITHSDFSPQSATQSQTIPKKPEKG